MGTPSLLLVECLLTVATAFACAGAGHAVAAHGISVAATVGVAVAVAAAVCAVQFGLVAPIATATRRAREAILLIADDVGDSDADDDALSIEGADDDDQNLEHLRPTKPVFAGGGGCAIATAELRGLADCDVTLTAALVLARPHIPQPVRDAIRDIDPITALEQRRYNSSAAAAMSPMQTSDTELPPEGGAAAIAADDEGRFDDDPDLDASLEQLSLSEGSLSQAYSTSLAGSTRMSSGGGSSLLHRPRGYAHHNASNNNNSTGMAMSTSPRSPSKFSSSASSPPLLFGAVRPPSGNALTTRLVTVVAVNCIGLHASATTSNACFAPPVIAASISSLAGIVERAAKAHHGVVSFHGDRFRLVFNGTRNCAAHASHAVMAAIRIATEAAVPLSCGVATGRCTIGSIGTANMKEVCVVGPAVSQAAVLERIAKARTRLDPEQRIGSSSSFVAGAPRSPARGVTPRSPATAAGGVGGVMKCVSPTLSSNGGGGGSGSAPPCSIVTTHRVVADIAGADVVTRYVDLVKLDGWGGPPRPTAVAELFPAASGDGMSASASARGTEWLYVVNKGESDPRAVFNQVFTALQIGDVAAAVTHFDGITDASGDGRADRPLPPLRLCAMMAKLRKSLLVPQPSAAAEESTSTVTADGTTEESRRAIRGAAAIDEAAWDPAADCYTRFGGAPAASPSAAAVVANRRQSRCRPVAALPPAVALPPAGADVFAGHRGDAEDVALYSTSLDGANIDALS